MVTHRESDKICQSSDVFPAVLTLVYVWMKSQQRINNDQILLGDNFASKISSITRTLPASDLISIDWKIALQIKPKFFDVVK